MYAPVWYIQIINSGNTEFKRVDALSGSIIRSNTSDTSKVQESEVSESSN